MINWSQLGTILKICVVKEKIHDFVFNFLHHISYEELERDFTLNDDMFYEPI